jgi:hypothetical protein
MVGPPPEQESTMEIQALKLLVSEKEINVFAGMALNGAPVRDVTVRVTTDGVHIRGKYQAWVSVGFETLWQLSIQAGKIRAQMTDVKVVGMPASMIRGMLTEIVGDVLGGEGGIQTENDILWIDLDQVLAQRGFPARTNLSGVLCAVGMITIESRLSS